MKTVTIEIPNGHVVDIDQSTGVIKFKEKPKLVTERIKYLDDAVGELGHNDPEVSRLKKLLSAFEKEDTIVGYQAMVVLAKALNEGWQPDWNDSNQNKYFAWFEMGGSSGFRFDGYDYWYSASLVGSRLCFKSYALAEYAGKQFTEFYKQFMTI